MRKNLNLMYIIAFLQGLIFYGPVSLIYKIQKGVSVKEAFFLEFFLLMITVFTEVLWGYFADKYGYKKTLIISYFLFFLSRVTLIFCNSFVSFFIETCIRGISVSGISGCDIAFLYSSCSENESEKVFGRYRAYNSTGFFISSILSVFIVGKSIELAIFLTSIAYGINVLIMYFTSDVEYKVDKKKESFNLKDSFKDRNLIKQMLVFVIATSLICEITYGITINLSQIHFKNIGFDFKFFGFITAFSELASLLSSKTYIFTNKFGQTKTLKFIITSTLIFVFILIFTENIIFSIVCIISLSGLTAMSSPIVLDIQNKFIKKNRATILSIYSMIGNIFAAIINILIGFLADMYVKYSFMLCFFILLIGVYGVYIYLSKTPKIETKIIRSK